MRSDGSRRAPLPLTIAAIGGLLFLHVPLLLIFLYAFTTEERATSSRRRAIRCNGSPSPGNGRTSGTRSGSH